MYEKTDVHSIVWTALWQAAMPVIIFNSLSDKAYLDSGLTTDPYTSRAHYTREVLAWEKIMIAHSAVWAPMFLFGALALSEVLSPIGALYIEHALSNMMIPAYLYGAY